jgi:hypothetical protein
MAEQYADWGPTGPTGPNGEQEPSIGEDTEQVNGVTQKYLALCVPQFSNSMTSYLCLGATQTWFNDNEGKDPSQYGATLANYVAGFCDDDRSLASTGSPTRGTVENESTTQAPAQSVDDTGSGTPGNTVTPPPGTSRPPYRHLMERESALLQTKGGWRDHSDGNRVTTTFGDKIEVIRGNYKLLVLGRQDDPSKQVAGWDVSGGLVTTNPKDLVYPPAQPSPDGPPQAQYGGQQALSTEYLWERNSDGTFGWTVISKTGSPAPTSNSGNGCVVNFTWVDEMFTYWGSGSPTSDSPPAGGAPRGEDPGVRTNQRPLKTSISREFAEAITLETRAMPAFGSTATPTLTTITGSDGAMATTVLAGMAADTFASPLSGAPTTTGTMSSVTACAGAMNTIVTSGPASPALTVATTAGAMNVATTCSGVMTSLVTAGSVPTAMILQPGTSGGDLNATTGASGAMNTLIVAGTPSLGTTLASTAATQPGAMTSTTASAGTMNVNIHTDADMNNVTSSNGHLHNLMSSNEEIYNQTTATSLITEYMVAGAIHTSVDQAVMQFNLALSGLILEMKTGVHADVHNLHLDLHTGSHLDFHFGPHVVLDMFDNAEVRVGTHAAVHAAPAAHVHAEPVTHTGVVFSFL